MKLILPGDIISPFWIGQLTTLDTSGQAGGRPGLPHEALRSTISLIFKGARASSRPAQFLSGFDVERSEMDRARRPVMGAG
jgi:hypothetical protein